VVIYGVSFLDQIIAYDILRIRLPFYCLVNIIAKKEVFPELIGPHFKFENLLSKAEELLEAPARGKIQADCDAIIKQLGGKETSTEAAAEVLQLISV
jgi:lipid-A-disaccharide synthase